MCACIVAEPRRSLAGSRSFSRLEVLTAALLTPPDRGHLPSLNTAVCEASAEAGGLHSASDMVRVLRKIAGFYRLLAQTVALTGFLLALACFVSYSPRYTHCWYSCASEMCSQHSFYSEEERAASGWSGLGKPVAADFLHPGLGSWSSCL